jgi:acyl-CoA reductase-like NAD-dependent aldehyde dehydrogenase
MAVQDQIVDRPAQLGTAGRLLIDGAWVEAASGRTFPTFDPATEQKLADVAHGDAEDIERPVSAARRAFDDGSPWRRMTRSDRGRLVHRIGDLILEHAEELATLKSLDNGKPRASRTFRWRPTCSTTWPAGSPSSRAPRSRSRP